MIRRAAAILLALTLNPALLYAQDKDTVLTVSVQSADVHQGPSTVTPVIGHAPRGAVLTVSRNLGSWAQIPWPDAPDGIAYVHVTMGRLSAPSANTPAASPSPRTSYASAPAQSPAPTTTAPRTPASAGDRTAGTGSQGGTTISHIVGVGGLVGSMSSFGASARTWRKNRLGIQVGVTRDVMTSDAAGRVTSMQVEPGVVYALFDRVRDYVWVRPYVGSALSFRHQTLTIPAPALMESTSDNGVGFRVFGGGELTFATVTRFGLSAEVGYRRLPTPFPGFEPDRMSVSIAGHWYVK
jgi:hypothetical protein